MTEPLASTFFSTLNEAFGAQLLLWGHPILWREIVGNAFGFASAIGGLSRRMWAWPVGIVGNALLFTVFFGVWFSNPQEGTLWGQAFRQVFFMLTGVYGWWRWKAVAGASGTSQSAGTGAPAIVPRWATARERLGYLLAWGVGLLLVGWVFATIGTGWPAPLWYHFADAWIFVGSLLATFAMARGWTDFWLIWLGVDAVGIPLLLHSQFYPSAALYGVYGLLVTYGFFVWWKASKAEILPQRAERRAQRA